MFETKDLIAAMGKLRGFALRLTDQPSDAEDLLQAALLKAIEKKHTFRTGSNLFAWSSKIMYNTFVTNYRRKKKHESRYDPEPILAALTYPDPNYDNLRCAEVDKAMQKLGRDQRQVLQGVCLQGEGYQEVANRLRIPVGTVRSRLSRAREELSSLDL